MMKYNDGKRKVTMKNKRKKGVYWKKFFYLVVVSIACTGISGHALRINGEKMTTILKTQNFKAKAETASKTTKAVLGQPKCITVTAVKKKIVITWKALQKVDGYEIYEAQEDRKYKSIGSTTKSKLVLSGKNIEKSYYYYVRAYVKKNGKKEYGKRSKIVSVKIPATGTSTIKNFLRTAMAPVGSTMYVWGGGWNKADTGAGTDAKLLVFVQHGENFQKIKQQIIIIRIIDIRYIMDWIVLDLLDGVYTMFYIQRMEKRVMFILLKNRQNNFLKWNSGRINHLPKSKIISLAIL